MYNCAPDLELHPPGPQWWKEMKHCHRRPTRIFNFDVQVGDGPIAYRRRRMERLIYLNYKAAKVADSPAYQERV